MSKPWNPRASDGRGRSRPGGSGSTANGWLSADAYDSLSAREKKALFEERSVARKQRQVLERHDRAFAPRVVRRRKEQYARHRMVWMVAVLAIAATGMPMWALDHWPSIASDPASTAPSAPIEWGSVQAVPKPALSAEDMEWQGRASADRQTPRSTSSGQDPSTGSGRASGVRVAFSACKWGGGTNCVVDGDTIYLAGEKIRIAGIDAPETHDYRCPGELALGEQAASRLQQLVGSGAITLSSIDRDRDRYGRLLRNIAVDGRDVGEVLISEGLARPYAGGRRPWC